MVAVGFSQENEISRLNGIYDNLLTGANVELFNARATVVDGNTVQVGDAQVSTDKILIATGGWPFVPDIPGAELTVTSNEIFDLEVFPKRILIVGGGYVAVRVCRDL